MKASEEVADAFVLYRGQVERIAAAILKDADEARDVAATAYVKFLELGPEEDSATLPWLSTVVRHGALNRLRDRKAQLRKEMRTWEAPAHLPTPDDGRPAALLGQAIGSLRTRDRLALHLRYAEDKSFEEIAAALRTSVPQARIVIHRGIKRLRHRVILELASHHGIGPDCVQAVCTPRAKPHADCRPCTTLADEIAAIRVPALDGGVGPVVAQIGNQVARLRARIASRTSWVATRRARLGESLMVFSLAATIAIPNWAGTTLPKTSVHSPRAGIENMSLTDGSTLRRSNPLPVARTRRVASSRSWADEGQVGDLNWPTTLLVPSVLRVADPLDVLLPDNLDIRAIAMQSIIENGRVSEVAVTMTLRGDIPPRDKDDAVYGVSFGRDQYTFSFEYSTAAKCYKISPDGSWVAHYCGASFTLTRGKQQQDGFWSPILAHHNVVRFSLNLRDHPITAKALAPASLDKVCITNINVFVKRQNGGETPTDKDTAAPPADPCQYKMR